MNNKNVCKFSPGNLSNDLSISCFVLETNLETMRTKVTLAHYRMILVEQGTGTFLFDNTAYNFSAGTLIFGFEGEAFALSSGENVRYLYIDFNGTRAGVLCHRFGIYPHTRKAEGFHAVIPFGKDCLLSAPQKSIDIAAESVLLYALSRLSADPSKENATIQKIIEKSEENFRDPSFSLSQIADAIGYNPKYLSHFFKKRMNVSFSEYLRTLRFQYAISLFELGISSVKNVALLSGFSDPLYFSNAFKKAIGISPKEFIARLSKNQDEAN